MKGYVGLWGRRALGILIFAGGYGMANLQAEDSAAILRQMQKEIQELKARDSEKSELIQKMRMRLDQYEKGHGSHTRSGEHEEGGAGHDGHDHHGGHEDHEGHYDHDGHDDHLISFEAGGVPVGIDLFSSFGVVMGGSTVGEEDLEFLNTGGHDPNLNGFDFTGLELSLSGQVDDYFTFFSSMVFNLDVSSLETDVELEESYVTSSSLPYGLEAKAGYYYTEFGLDNAQHAHERIWLDQSLLRSRMLGSDGMRSAGFRMAWDAPVDWDSRLITGFQSARGLAGFGGSELVHAHGEGEEDEHGHEQTLTGRPDGGLEIKSPDDFLWSVRFENGWQLHDTVRLEVGTSGAFGPNFTGDDGFTALGGGDVSVLWKPEDSADEGRQLLWQSELAFRHLNADAQSSDAGLLDDEVFEDISFYTLLLYSFNKKWHMGLRYEYADKLAGNSIHIDDGELEDAGASDPFRTERHRVSPLVMYQVSDHTRFRLQYNYDRVEYMDDDEAHSVWFGMEFAIGSGGHDHGH